MAPSDAADAAMGAGSGSGSGAANLNINRMSNKRSSVPHPGYPAVVPALPLRPSARPRQSAPIAARLANTNLDVVPALDEANVNNNSGPNHPAQASQPAADIKNNVNNVNSLNLNLPKPADIPAALTTPIANGTITKKTGAQAPTSGSHDAGHQKVTFGVAAASTPSPPLPREASHAFAATSQIPSTTTGAQEPLPIVVPHSHTSSSTETSPAQRNGFAHLPPHPLSAQDGIVHPANGGVMHHPPGFHPQPPMHHPHPSESSLMFAMPDSNNTSPGPPSSGIYPPPGPHYHGFPAHGPPPPHWRRPMPVPVPVALPNGTMTGYPPAMFGYDPTTPHSFHGSQSSNPADPSGPFEENSFHTHHLPHTLPAMLANGVPNGPPNGVSNGLPNGLPSGLANGAPNGVANGVLNGVPTGIPSGVPNGFPNGRSTMDHNSNSASQSIMLPGGVQSSVPPVPPSHRLADEHQRAAQNYIEMNFNNPETADCRVHISLVAQPSSAPWHAPIDMVGHRLVLGFSPALRDHLTAVPPIGGTLTLKLNDPYLRNDILWACLESLYGKALPDGPERDFDTAAAYLAAGNALHLGRLVIKGTEEIIRLITSWDVLERALQLALHGGVPQFPPLASNSPTTYPEFHYRYGQAADRIVENIATYIINNFPPNFRLDAACANPPYSRVPQVPMARAARRPAPRTAPATEHLQTSTALLQFSGARSANPRLSSIQFGDISLPGASEKTSFDAEVLEAPEVPTPSVRPSTANGLLSSVLLNLPFGVLKHVMENTGLGNISGWMTTQDRHKVVSDVVAEREARRVHAVDAVLDGRVANSAAIRARLSSPQPQMGDDLWDVLGWREAIAGSDEAPIIVRDWVPLARDSNPVSIPLAF